MVWKTAVIGLLASASPVETLEKSLGEMKEWLDTHSPYGLDLYPDGTIWISAGEGSSGTESGLLAKDVRALAAGKGYVWVMENHRADKTVPYRTTKSRIYFDCPDGTMSTQVTIRYMADGKVHGYERDSSIFGRHDAPIPGTVGERWMELACQR